MAGPLACGCGGLERLGALVLGERPDVGAAVEPLAAAVHGAGPAPQPVQACGGDDGGVRVADLAGGDAFAEADDAPVLGVAADQAGVLVGPDEGLADVGQSSSGMWPPARRSPRWPGTWRRCARSPSAHGQTLATASKDETVKLSGPPPMPCGPRSKATAAGWWACPSAPDGRTLASSGEDAPSSCGTWRPRRPGDAQGAPPRRRERRGASARRPQPAERRRGGHHPTLGPRPRPVPVGRDVLLEDDHRPGVRARRPDLRQRQQ